MRLPLAVSLTSRDGTLGKDPLITNGLVEGNKKVSVVRLRPGVTDFGLVTAGTARLLTCWNGLLSVVGSSLSSVVLSAVPAGFDFASDTLSADNTDYLGGIIRCGSKFYVSLVTATSPSVVVAHFYGSHDTGFAASTAVANNRAVTVAANSATAVVTFIDSSNFTPGYLPQLYRSTNSGAPTFTQVVSDAACVGWDIGYFGGYFVAVLPLASGTGAKIYWSSDDGVTWSSTSISGSRLRAVAYTGSVWWFFGGTSDDSAGDAYYTTDFSTFTHQAVTGITDYIIKAAWCEDHFTVIVRDYLLGDITYTSATGATFAYSTDVFYAIEQETNGTYAITPSLSGLALVKLGTVTTTLFDSAEIRSFLPLFAGDYNHFCVSAQSASNAILAVASSFNNYTATPTSVGTLVDAYLSSEATGAAQSSQQLLFKSSEKLWVYTVEAGLALVTDIDYPGHHTYTVSSMTRSSSTVTVNTATVNSLSFGDSITVAGADQTDYNGSYTVASVVDTDTFTYTVTTTPVTPATGTVTVYGGKITVPGIIFLDGYFFVMTDKGVIYNSALGDGTSWNALNFVTAAEEPGNGVALGKSANYLVALKEWSTEPFYDAGNATGSPISPVKSMSTRVGCASGASLVDVDDKLIWISQTKDKGRSVHVMQGLQQQTSVATSDVERVLELDDLASVSAYGLRIAGHVLYVLTLHTSAITLVYDLTSGVWYQWTSLTANTPLSVSSMARSGTTVTVVTSTAHGRSDGDPVLFAGADQSDYNGRFNVAVISSTSLSFQVDSSQATTATGTITATTYTEGHFAYTKHVYCSGRHLLLHESNGHLYEFTDEVASDALAPIDLHCRTGKIDNGNAEPKRLALLEVVGHKTPNGLALVRWTDDDYTSWSTYRSVALEQERSQLRRCGDFSRRAFELRYTGDAKVTLGALELDVKGR